MTDRFRHLIPAVAALSMVTPCSAELPSPSSKGLAASYTCEANVGQVGPHAPRLSPFGDAQALHFDGKRLTRVDLGQGRDECLRLRGALTLATVVQLTQLPRTKTPFVSKWNTGANGRSYEIGVTPARKVFFAISASGKYDSQAREVYSALMLRLGVPYTVVGVYEPGRRMAVYINGVLSGRLGSRIPKTIFDSPTPVLLGNRPGNERGCGLDGLLAGAWIYSAALRPDVISAWTKELGLTEPPESEFPEHELLPPVRAITRGPKHHWFGYYDKLELDPTGRYVLGMEVDFEHRSPTPDDEIKVGMVDLRDNDRWIELGETRAWCWQQGCMLQWRPGSATEVMWNDRRGDRFVCHILDVVTRKKRTIPHPIYSVSPNGRHAVAPDFRRIHDVRRGYGYAGIPDPNRDVLAPKDAGVWHVDLETGESKLIISFVQIAKIPYRKGDLSHAKHYFNHLLFSPDGSRFIFLHRWRSSKPPRAGTRMFTAKPDGTDVRIVDDYGSTSHFIWRDPQHILAWSRHPSHGSGFYLYEDGTREVEIVGKGIMTQNGHCTYLPGNQWILNDTYPDWQRKQHPYLYHVPTGKRFFLGHFQLPPKYGGEWRCDTHPRFSPDGRMVVIDSPHGGEGRQLWLIEVGDVTREE